MSAQDIIAELPKLQRVELELVDAKIHELLTSSEKQKSVWERLQDIAGSAEGLPADLSEQHDHYLHGTPKR
ncbi:MAG: hypothetical protein ACR2IE_15890 [Candidatus Sumerlaeaceae bacterium]